MVRVAAAAGVWFALVASLMSSHGAPALGTEAAPPSSRDATEDALQPAMASPVVTSSAPRPADGDALAAANWWRSHAGRYPDAVPLPPLTPDEGRAAAAQHQIDYLDWLRSVGSSYCGHDLDRSIADAPEFGDRSHNVLFCDLGLDDAVEGWLRTPLHGAPFLDPGAVSVGFGTGASGSAAGFVWADRPEIEALRSDTWVYPAPGGTLASLEWWGSERPDPSVACPPLDGVANGAPVGAYLPYPATYRVTNWSLVSASGDEIETCLMSDADRLEAGDPVDPWKFVYVFPRRPLRDRTEYRISMVFTRTDGETTTPLALGWTFTAALPSTPEPS